MTPRAGWWSLCVVGWHSPEVAVFEPVGVSFEGDDFGVVDEPVAMVRNELGVLIGMVHYMIPYAVLPILALYVVAAEEQGVAPNQLAGPIQTGPNETSRWRHSRRCFGRAFSPR